MLPKLKELKHRAKNLKTEVHALYFACKDPRVPLYAKVFIACMVGYALSPVDLIPDFIPVLGYLDELVLIPLGITLAIRMIPAGVLEECRQKAVAATGGRPRGWAAAVVIVFIWVLIAAALFTLIYKYTISPTVFPKG